MSLQNTPPPRLPDVEKDVDKGYITGLLRALRLYFNGLFTLMGGVLSWLETLQTDVDTLQTDVDTLQTNSGFTPVLMYALHTAGETPAVNGTLVNWTAQINVGGGGFSSGVYTVPVTGRYRIHAGLLLDTTAAGAGSGIHVKINSTQQCRIFYGFGPTGGYGMGSGEQVFDLTAGDTVALTSQLAVTWFGGAGVNGVGGWIIERIRSA